VLIIEPTLTRNGKKKWQKIVNPTIESRIDGTIIAIVDAAICEIRDYSPICTFASASGAFLE
jgi:hypothetical protein